MKKKYLQKLLLIILLYFLNVKKFKIYEHFNYLNNVSTFNYSININYVKKITKRISIYRPIQSKNLKNVKKFVMNELYKISGLNVYEQFFNKKINGINYYFSNIIAKNNIKKNKDYILLSAHIDSPFIENIEASIDSATSIALIIEITNKILNLIPTFPLLLVFFDGEEALNDIWKKENTLFGSKYFVDNLKFKIKKAFILDLIGGNFNNKIKHFSNNPLSYEINKELYKINKKYKNKIFISPSVIKSKKYIFDDHIPFMLNNIPYIHLIPDNFPINHHTINDNYKNVNWNYVNIFGNILLEYLLNK